MIQDSQLTSIPIDNETNEDEKELVEKLEESMYTIPYLTYWQVFTKFLDFGLRAWGGAIPQIAMLKDELVVRDKWISLQQFNRVFAVYQVLPGPEATELCCYFGYIARGRLGGILSGIAFLLPGFVSIMFFSWIYTLIGTSNIYFNASFQALQPLVAAMFIKAVHKIGVDAIYPESGSLNFELFLVALLSGFNTALRINLFITMFYFGLLYAVYRKEYRNTAIIFLFSQYIVYAVLVSLYGFPTDSSMSIGISPNPAPERLLALGLLAGSLSFGGAYTVIPIMLQEAVMQGQWITHETFLHGIAIANVLPAPTVIFSTFVGFIGGKVYSGADKFGVGGSVWMGMLGGFLMTIGMFTAPFAFTVIGHPLLQKITAMTSIHSLFDGITASVVGLIAVTSLEILRDSIVINKLSSATLDATLESISNNGLRVIIFAMTLYVMYNYKFLN